MTRKLEFVRMTNGACERRLCGRGGMADALVLGASGQPCGFKSHRPHQKRCFTVDFLTKELHNNNGEVPQYYVEGSHEAIIAPEKFEAVQEEMARRKELGRAYSDKAFHSKIICGDCGGFYGRKVWHSTDEYKSVVFQRNQKFKNAEKCHTPT